MAQMKLVSFDELLDEEFGKIGTQKRDKFERSVDEDVRAYHIGEAIKQARLSKNLTQQELGDKIGVQRAQISRLEKGRSVTLTTLMRVFKAMDITASLELGGIGKVALY